MKKNWEVHASPYFTRALCPKHDKDMIELQNGFFGNPVWWCHVCGYPYHLDFIKLRKWSQENVDKQLKSKSFEALSKVYPKRIDSRKLE